MEQIPEHIAILLFLYLNESISDEEQAELDNWVSGSTHHEAIFKRAKQDKLFEDLGKFESIRKDLAWENLLKAIEERDQPPVQARAMNFNTKKLVIWTVAASVFFCLSYWMYHTISTNIKPGRFTSPVAVNISPGSHGAILTLANGKQVLLDSLKNGEIALQNGQRATLKNGSLIYDNAADSPVYNTVSAPKRRQFQMILPDGTKVWLNSESSIHFPTSFVGGERRVEITGEVYFEVAKNKNQLFRVITKEKVEVVVLGTHFNINSYENEDRTSTTLLEGSVRVIHDERAVVIRPGQQAQVSSRGIKNNNGIQVIGHVDLEKVVAWKNGVFNFDGVELTEVMRQLERWYDIEVKYEGQIPNLKFFGEISRNENLSDVLKALEESHVQFRLEEGRRLIILAK